MPRRIVVANEPRLYRDALAGALQVQCPADETIAVEPEHLEANVAETRPDVVITTTPSPALHAYDGVSLLLYPFENHQVVLRRPGQMAHTVERPELADILSLIDGLPTI